MATASAALESRHQPAGDFDPRITTFERPSHHYRYLQTADGDWLATADGETLHVQGHVNDAAIWDAEGDGFVHAASGLRLSASIDETSGACRLARNGIAVGTDGTLGEAGDFAVGHGPEQLPSESLRILREQGWVALTCILEPSVVDGLQQVGCVDAYANRTPARTTPLVQHPAVAKMTAEPVSLWLTREYMRTNDIRLGHSPGITALTRDDGEREVQGWHTDFPYLWGTGDRVPLPSGDLVLGMQRNVCVSDFTRTNGGTLFKLGSHATAAPPPEEWGISRHTYRKGHRAKFGLPYSGPESDLIEAPAGTIILYDARTWHRAGMNFTDSKRGAQIQAIIPGFIVPFMDTSATYKAFLASAAYNGLTERERREVERLMVQKIVGPAGVFAITVDEELTERARRQRDDRESLY